MKKLGMYTARGQITEAGGAQRVQLFDGRFDTGYKVVEFHAWGGDMSASSNVDVSAKLATDPEVETAATNFFNAGDNREIAWASSAGSADTAFNAPPGSVIDPENMVIEDLWVVGRAPVNTAPINYMIVMEKYDIGLNVGAYTMVRNSGQDINNQDR